MNALLGIQLALAAAGGAMIGSFLTVVAARVPAIVMEERSMAATMGGALKAISWPGSHCPACSTPLKWRDNLPVLSYCLLGGRCRCCARPYGAKYFILESLSALAAIVCVLAFGWGGQALLAFFLLASLLALSAIDFAEQLLPDVLVFPLLPLGVLFQSRYGDGVTASLLGAAIAYLVMWAIGAAYRLGAGRDGMGLGDVKLAAVLGAWLGGAGVPFFLMAAFAGGVLFNLPMLALGLAKRDTPIPFGPFLCLSGTLFVLMPWATPWLERALFAG